MANGRKYELADYMRNMSWPTRKYEHYPVNLRLVDYIIMSGFLDRYEQFKKYYFLYLSVWKLAWAVFKTYMLESKEGKLGRILLFR